MAAADPSILMSGTRRRTRPVHRSQPEAGRLKVGAGGTAGTPAERPLLPLAGVVRQS